MPHLPFLRSPTISAETTIEWKGRWIYLDAVDHRGVLTGWAFDGEHPGQRLSLTVFVDERVVGTVTANMFRKDLLVHGVGDGNHAFSILLPKQYLDGAVHAVRAVDSRGGPTPKGRAAIDVPFVKPFSITGGWRGLPQPTDGASDETYRRFLELKHSIMRGSADDIGNEVAGLLDERPELIFSDFGFREQAARRGRTFSSFGERLAARLASPATPALIHRFNRKLFTKEYCRRHGIRTAGLLQIIRDLREIDLTSLPERCVIKPENDSGVCTFLYTDGMDLLSRRATSIDEIRAAMKAYKQRNPDALLLVEEVLGQRGGPKDAVPLDYKLHAFGGTVRLIHVNDWNVYSSRNHSFQQQGWFARNWVPAPHRMRVAEEEAIDFMMPESLGEMIQIAEQIQSECGDYVRVDLYDTREGVALGEVTITSHAGRGYTEFGDCVLAQAWHVSRLKLPEQETSWG